MERSVIYLLVISLFFASCESNDKNTDTANVNDSAKNDSFNRFDSLETVNEEDTQDEIKKYIVDKRCIVFFMPTSKEIDKLVEHYGIYTKFDFQQMFSSFKSLASTTKQNMNEKGIYSELTTASYFEIISDTSVIVFDRKAEDEILGQILYNGKDEPLIKFGLYKNNELTDLIREYFGLQDYENAELDSIENSDEEDILYEENDGAR